MSQKSNYERYQDYKQEYKVNSKANAVRVFIQNASTETFQRVTPTDIISVSTSKNIYNGYGSFELRFVVTELSDKLLSVDNMSTKVDSKDPDWLSQVRPMSLIHIFMGDATDIDEVAGLTYQKPNIGGKVVEPVVPKDTPQDQTIPDFINTKGRESQATLPTVRTSNLVDKNSKLAKEVFSETPTGQKYLKYSVMLGVIETIDFSIQNNGDGYRKIATITGHDLMKPFFTDSLIMSGPIVNQRSPFHTGIVPVFGIAKKEPADSITTMREGIRDLFNQVANAVNSKLPSAPGAVAEKDGTYSNYGWRLKLVVDRGLSVPPEQYLREILNAAPITSFMFGPRIYSKRNIGFTPTVAEEGAELRGDRSGGGYASSIQDLYSTKGVLNLIELNPIIERLNDGRVSLVNAISFQGTLYQLLAKALPTPIIEMFGDTVGDRMELVVRRPPFWRSSLMGGSVTSTYAKLMADGYRSINPNSQLPGDVSQESTRYYPDNPYTKEFERNYRGDLPPTISSGYSIDLDDHFLSEPNRLDFLKYDPKKGPQNKDLNRYHVIEHSDIISIQYGAGDSRVATAYQTFPSSPLLDAQAPAPTFYPMLVDFPATRVFGLRNSQIPSPWEDSYSPGNVKVSIDADGNVKVTATGEKKPIEPTRPDVTATKFTAQGKVHVITLDSPVTSQMYLRVNISGKPFKGANPESLLIELDYGQGNIIKNLKIGPEVVTPRTRDTMKFFPFKDLTPDQESALRKVVVTPPIAPKTVLRWSYGGTTTGTDTVAGINFTPTTVNVTNPRASWIILAYRETILQYLMNRDNSYLRTGTMTIVGRPTIRIGDKVYLPSKDMLAYVEGVRNSYDIGGTVYTTVTFGRGQPLKPTSSRLVNYDKGDDVVIYKENL